MRIRKLEAILKKTLALQTQKELLTLRQQHNQIVNSELKEKLCRQSIYEYGNKPGVLARAWKGSQTKSHITQITSESGTKLSDPESIAQEFQKFYRKLYNLPNTQIQQGVSWAGLISTYLTSSGMPSLSSEIIEGMEAPITDKELTKAIDSSKLGKAPGPDGLNLAYYKTFHDVLSPYFFVLLILFQLIVSYR